MSIAGQFDQVRCSLHPRHVSEETLHERFQQDTGIDTDHPDYVELQADWAVEYRADLATEQVER